MNDTTPSNSTMNDLAPPPATKRRQGRPKTFNKQAVLDIAIDAYWSGDPESVSVNQICKYAGVSKPSLYREFGNEDGLRLSALEHYMSTIGTDVAAILTSDESFETKMETLIDFMTVDERFCRGCLYIKMRAAKHCFSPRVQQKLTELEAMVDTIYIACVTQNLANNEWTQEKIALAARYIMEQIGLGFTQRAAGQDPNMIRAMFKIAMSVFSSPMIPFSHTASSTPS